MSAYQAIEWKNGILRMLDQRLLPHEITYRDFTDAQGVAEAIKTMVIRGAPAIGAAAGYGLALTAFNSDVTNVVTMKHELTKAAEILCAARPTAINLAYAINRIMNKIALSTDDTVAILRQSVLDEAQAIAENEVRACRQIGLNGLPLVPPKAKFIHHCNTGPLATVDYGTALGVIRAAHENGKDVFVYVDETRPRLQGARLTSWELTQLGIAHAVIVDGASGFVMKTRGVDLVTVGCDRVAANGDTANKIGTYNLAIVAKAHRVPFYVVGPTTSIDLSISGGDQIPVEDRDMIEVAQIGQELILPEHAIAINPAFDVTPAEYITAIITEQGIAYPPYRESLQRLVKLARSMNPSYSSHT